MKRIAHEFLFYPHAKVGDRAFPETEYCELAAALQNPNFREPPALARSSRPPCSPMAISFVNEKLSEKIFRLFGALFRHHNGFRLANWV